jgi:hypothetical protein
MEYTRKHLINEFSRAYEIHKRYVKRQRNRRKSGKKPIKNVGSEEWHREWCQIYKCAIKYLKK